MACHSFLSKAAALGLQLAFLVCILGSIHPAVAASPVISEFMASNQDGLLDEDGDASDWIELHNPGPDPVQLEGWSLTDNAGAPQKWRFPARTLAPGEFIVVFASGKNRTGPGVLHTNFRLDAAGEYLGLLDAAGTVASEFRPAFPPQESDLSYGLPASAGSRELLAGVPLAVLVPTEAGSMPPTWKEPGFIPDTSWQTLPGFGVGFDDVSPGPGSDTNFASGGTAFQSTTGFGLGPAAALDGDPDSFTHTDTDDTESAWWVDLGSVHEISRIVLWNRTSCCQSRLRDLTVSLLAADGSTVWSSDLLNPENQLNSPESITLDFYELNLGPLAAQTVRVTRTPDPDLSGSGGTGNDDEDNVLSLGEVEIYGVESLSFGDLIRSDLATTLRGRNASVLMRVPFVLEDAAAVRSLVLSLQYDDGVAVYLNGQEITAFNAPAPLLWNSAAVTNRGKSEAFTAEAIDLTPLRGRWDSGTNWLAFHALNASAEDPDFLLNVTLRAESEGPRFVAYLDRPTPGAANHVSWSLGRVSDTKFSVNRGVHGEPFDLTIETSTPGAEIRYTLDGTAPGPAHGTLYTGPLRISKTTVVRAAAFKADYRPTNIDTHTYLFLADVVNQSANPPGFPASWSGENADYAMDTRITRSPAYASRLNESLLSLPTLSLVLPTDDLFGASRGIYANPERSGVAWERPVSMEWIEPQVTNDFQVDAGLRIQGGYFRARSVTGKHSLRLLFKNVYGPGRLRRDLFGEPDAAREFDTLVLRAGANDGYAWDAARDTEQFLRDEFGRRLLLAMGQPSARGRFVHLYLNGLYWGLYNLTERPAEDFSATYLGGEPEDWDAINSGEVKSGSLEAWNAFLSRINSARTVADYQRLKGEDVNGVRDPSLPAYLNAPNYIDYMLLNIWGGNWDWPNKNYWFGRDRRGVDGGFRFYLWDFENTMGNNRDRSPLNMVSPRPGTQDSGVGQPHHRLRQLAEYRLEFADRVQRHFFGDGALTPESLAARYRELADRIEAAIIAETARWGDDHHSPPQDLSDWQRERNWILGTYLPQRTGIVLKQLRASGLYPQTPAPVISPRSGPLSSPVTLTVTAPELYYTTNGLDPRLIGGAVRPEAIRVSGAEGATLTESLTLTASGLVRARARMGGEWSALSEALYSVDSVPASARNLVIAQFCYRPPEPVTPAERAVSINQDDYEFIELLNIGPDIVDLQGVRFTAGILYGFPAGSALAPGERLLLVANIPAFTTRHGNALRVDGEYVGRLDNAGEEIVLSDAAGRDVRRFVYGDRPPWPALPNTAGHALVLQRPQVNPDHADPSQWRSGTRPGGMPGASDATTFSGDPGADTDGNGQPDLLDYALGVSSGSEPQPLLLSVQPGVNPQSPTHHLELTFTRNLAADDTRILLEQAESLVGPWSSDLASIQLSQEEAVSGSVVRLTYRLVEPLENRAAVFIRLSVVPRE